MLVSAKHQHESAIGIQRVTHLVSGLLKAQVLCVSVQKEFSERQSDGQDLDLLI